MILIDFIKAIPAFKELSDLSLALITGKLERMFVKNGEYIIHCGEEADALYIIEAGEVKVQITVDGEAKEIAVLKDGDIVGEMALLTNEPRFADVVANGDVYLYRLKKDDFLDICRRFPSVSNFLTHLLADRLGEEADVMVNKTIGKYKILNQIARGGMGVIFKGIHTGLNRQVAIKMLPHPLVFDPTYLKGFKQEAMLVSQLNHPNIVQVYDTDYVYNTYFIMMEFIEGYTLRDVLIEQGKFSPFLTEKIAGQLCKVLLYAHKEGVIHRDIKPENIMLDTSNNVKLMDFGIARKQQSSQPKDYLGTPEYIPPEVIAGKEAGPKGDIYSFGVMLYELLVGRTPYEGDGVLSVSYQQMTKPAIPPNELVEDIPLHLNNFIMRCIKINPDERLGDLQLFVDDAKANFKDIGGKRDTALWVDQSSRATVSCDHSPGDEGPAGQKEFCKKAIIEQILPLGELPGGKELVRKVKDFVKEL